MLTEKQFRFWQKYVEFVFEFAALYSLLLLGIFFPWSFLFETVYLVGVAVLGPLAILVLINIAIETWKPWLDEVSYSEYLRRRQEVLLIVHCKG